MSLYIVVEDRTLTVPREVEAEGPAAVAAWVTEQMETPAPTEQVSDE